MGLDSFPPPNKLSHHLKTLLYLPGLSLCSVKFCVCLSSFPTEDLCTGQTRSHCQRLPAVASSAVVLVSNVQQRVPADPPSAVGTCFLDVLNMCCDD